MALRGKHSAEKEIRGNHIDHYMRLPGWMYMLRERNPGSIVRLELDNDQKSFKYLFIALSATIKGWKYMRKVVAVDATFLTSKYKGALVVATAQDGEHHQYPLAWGVIDREKDASWRWFMNRLSEVILDGPDVVLISDRHKSIMKAVREVYKQADHGFCARHISQNLKSHVNRGAGRKGSRGETVAKLYPKAAEYVQKEELAPEKWARYKFRTERYNLLTTNGAESINSVLKKAKRYPLLSLLDICVSKTAEWFSRYRVEACGADDSQKLTPYVYKVLHERFEKACTYEVIELNRLSGMFEARDEKGRRNLVNLGDRTCSCKKFDVDSFRSNNAQRLSTLIPPPNHLYDRTLHSQSVEFVKFDQWDQWDHWDRQDVIKVNRGAKQAFDGIMLNDFQPRFLLRTICMIVHYTPKALNS
ncbi:PREDICTED: uncharacterized protein LOC104827520 [Tarenaya hassleriana]|uniref:uncharacterized protein LOC104827520 n=1 Tax=Tarenaya hassleriana TaxID=28532 RepID=UPI00053C4579|nr:PREDICTED: uncharacterized protein LOC104827520 [Tarenaya hassleriana]